MSNPSSLGTSSSNACSVAQSCLTLCSPREYSPPGSFSMGLSRQEYWSGLPFPPPGDLPTQQSNLGLRCPLHCTHILYHWATGEASFSTTFILSFSVTFFFNSAVPGLSCSTQDLWSSTVACGIFFSFVVVQSLSHVWLFATLWIAAHQASLSFTILECAQTHVHWVKDAIQPSHPLLPTSPALNLSQHQGLFQWIGALHKVARVLELQLQHQSFQWIFRVDFL